MVGQSLIENSTINRATNDIVREGVGQISSDINEMKRQQLLSTAAIIANLSSSSPELDELLDKGLSNERFNLFVISNVGFTGKGNSFVISKDRIMRREVSEQYDVFGEDVKNFPSLFVTANTGRKFGKSKDPDQVFYYGKVESVSEHGRKDLSVCFRKLFNKPMRQQYLNEFAAEIGINADDGIDLLGGSNWIVKPIDIRAELTKHGIEYS